MSRTIGEVAGKCNRANGRNGGGGHAGVGTVSGAGRCVRHERVGADQNAGQGARRRNGVSGVEAVHVAVGANRLLNIADVHDAAGAVGTLLPGACADEEDRDEGEQDKDDDRQFEEGHTCFALHALGVSQFHFVLSGCVVVLFVSA